MQKRQEMYDKLIKKIDENIESTATRIDQITKHFHTDGNTHPPTYTFITELQTLLIS